MAVIVIPFIVFGGIIALTGTCEFACNYFYADYYFEIYLKRNPRVELNIEKLINDYKSKRQHIQIYIQIDIKAFYRALWILFNKPEKTLRLNGDYSIAYMIKTYLENTSDKNKNNLLKKMVQYHNLGYLLYKKVNGIPIISLLIVLLYENVVLSSDKTTFFIEFIYGDESLKMGPYLNNLYPMLFYLKKR